MGNPKFYSIDDLNIYSFNSVVRYVTIKWKQQYKGNRYYRIKLTKSSYSPSDFTTTYLYLRPYITDPNWIYTYSFSITSVKTSSLTDTSFEALFTQYSTRDVLRVYANLQSSASSNFVSPETSDETLDFSIFLKGDSFAPSWSTQPSWRDIYYVSNPGIRALTGSDQKGCQGVSNIRFDIPDATAKYGTSIDEYKIDIGGYFSYTLTQAQLTEAGNKYNLNLAGADNNLRNVSGSVSVTISVEDTRGFITTWQRQLTIVPYSTIKLTSDDTHRQGGVGSTVKLDFKGSWHGSPLTLSCISVKAYEEGSSTEYASITPTLTISGKSFSYSGTWDNVAFDPKKTYKLIAIFTDTLTSPQIKLSIPVGTPVMSIRDEKVGINNPSPQSALDVNGIIKQNGHNILGFVKIIEPQSGSDTVDLNDCNDTGYYAYYTIVNNILNFPNTTNPNRACLVETLSFGSYKIMKLFYLNNAETHIRTKSLYSWGSWKKITMS